MDKTTEERCRLGITSAYRASHPSRRLNCQALFHPVGGIARQGTDAGQFYGAQALLVLPLLLLLLLLLLGCGGGAGASGVSGVTGGGTLKAFGVGAEKVLSTSESFQEVRSVKK